MNESVENDHPIRETSHPLAIHPLLNNNDLENCEAAEEAVTTDSEEYLSECLR